MADIAANIYIYRNKCGYTQKELADMLGVSVQTVSKWERGASYPDVTSVPQIAAALLISVGELFNIDDTIDTNHHLTHYYDEMAELMMSRIRFAMPEYTIDITPDSRKAKLDAIINEMKKNPEYEEGIAKPGIIGFYVSMDTGFIALDDVNKKIFGDDNDEIFDFLGDKKNRRVLELIYESYTETLSANYIAETLGYDIEDVTNCLEFMAKHMMLRKNDVMIGKDRNMTFYKLERPVGSREFLMLRVIGAFGRKFLKKPQNFRAFMD